VAESVRRLVDGVRPQIIINAAAYTDVDGCETKRELAMAVNAAGPAHIAAEAKRVGARFIHISTDFVFDGEQDEPYLEDDPPHPIQFYGESKLEGERRVQQVGGDNWVIMRTAWLYGRDKGFPNSVRKWAASKPEISVVTDQIGSPTYAADLADMVWKAALGRITGVYHAVNTGHCSRFDLAREVVRLIGSKCAVSAASSDQFPLPAKRPACTILSTEKLIADLGIEIRSWRAALVEFVRET
jgi:dTDP-4-dehydrorhamnose reductase